VLGKPRDLAEARAMIRRLQGRTHEVYTAVCLAREHPRLRQTFVEQSRVTFRPLAEREIRAYLARIDPLDKAGAYAAQEPTDLRIIARIEGSRTNVYGLPMERLAPMLRALGFVPAG
jgi:septum formation protein